MNEIEGGGRLEGNRGVLIVGQGDGNDNSNSRIVGTIKGLTIHDGAPAVSVSFRPGYGTNNEVSLDVRDTTFISNSGSSGEFLVSTNDGAAMHIEGSAAQFAERNTNFNIAGVLPDFTKSPHETCSMPGRRSRHPACPLKSRARDRVNSARVSWGAPVGSPRLRQEAERSHSFRRSRQGPVDGTP